MKREKQICLTGTKFRPPYLVIDDFERKPFLKIGIADKAEIMRKLLESLNNIGATHNILPPKQDLPAAAGIQTPAAVLGEGSMNEEKKGRTGRTGWTGETSEKQENEPAGCQFYFPPTLVVRNK